MINEPCFRAPFLAVTGIGAIDFVIFAFAIGLRLFYMVFSLFLTLSLSDFSIQFGRRLSFSLSAL